MRIVIEVDASLEEAEEIGRRLREMVRREREVLPAPTAMTRDSRTLSLNDPDRYTILPSVDDYGQHEAIDNRTGRRGMMIGGFGFVAGAYVRDDGRVAFEHPWDNPMH